MNATERSAMEHGGYLATAAKDFLDACNVVEEARMRHDEAEPGADAAEAYDVMHAAEERRSDLWSGLRTAIYEFEKRRDRAAAENQRAAEFQAALDEEIDP